MNTVKTVPKHIAIIMDGNRRWAKERGLPVVAGHKKVADDILEPLVEYAADKGISYLTFWAWSTENWKRNENEIKAIMQIFRHLIRDQWQRLHEKGVRIKIIGDTSKFPKDIQESLVRVVKQTEPNKRITVIFALNYGGRDEVLRAIIKLHGNSKFEIRNLKFTEIEFEQCLDTVGVPDPDMIVRTGGEQRLSGFLLWQSEYSELYFPTWYMPEFTEEKLDEVIEEFQLRHRRYGK